jgi:hypothetical protein
VDLGFKRCDGILFELVFKGLLEFASVQYPSEET